MKPFAIECIEPAAGPPGILEARIVGYLDPHTVVTFEKTVAELLERGYVKFVLDLSELTYISSAGIGALMVLLKDLQRRGGDMVLLQPSPKVFKILALLGFTRIFQIKQERDEAVQVLQQG